MDTTQFDSLTRMIGSTLTRRGMLATLAGVAAFLPLDAPEIEARRKRKKRKNAQDRGKCKRNQKKCGKKCITVDSCCTSEDCGELGDCVSGTCLCPAGKKPCAGRCIAESACCRHDECDVQQHCENGSCVASALTKGCGDGVISRDYCCEGECPGIQTCQDGLCVCPLPEMWPCPDGSCKAGGQCCLNSQCPGSHVCADGYCACPDASDVVCDADCCDGAANEICNSEDVPSFCTNGGCQLSDWCNTSDYQVCEDVGTSYCVCLTAFASSGEEAACIDYYSLYQDSDDCTSCTTSSDCDPGWACVQGSDSADTGYCSCTGFFCAQVCDESGSMRERHRSAKVAAADARIAELPRAKPRRTGK